MKTFLNRVALLLCGAALGLSACKKDSAGDDATPTGNGTGTQSVTNGSFSIHKFR